MRLSQITEQSRDDGAWRDQLRQQVEKTLRDVSVRSMGRSSALPSFDEVVDTVVDRTLYEIVGVSELEVTAESLRIRGGPSADFLTATILRSAGERAVRALEDSAVEYVVLDYVNNNDPWVFDMRSHASGLPSHESLIDLLLRLRAKLRVRARRSIARFWRTYDSGSTASVRGATPTPLMWRLPRSDRSDDPDVSLALDDFYLCNVDRAWEV